MIILGSFRILGNDGTAIAKVVRVKDGEILAIARETHQGKPPAVAQTQNAIIDSVENLQANSSKSLALNLANSGILSVAVTVVRGNPVDVYILQSTELKKIKRGNQFLQYSDFEAVKTKNYKRSAHLDRGNYYLVLRDRTLGILSLPSSDIKVMVQMIE